MEARKTVGDWREFWVKLGLEISTWVMPEARDEQFTWELINKFSALAKSFGISSWNFGISEQYVDEEKPHYHFKVSFNQKSYFISSYFQQRYQATLKQTDENETHHGGLVEIELWVDKQFEYLTTLLLHAIFAFYDDAIRKYYPEWETEYKIE